MCYFPVFFFRIVMSISVPPNNFLSISSFFLFLISFFFAYLIHILRLWLYFLISLLFIPLCFFLPSFESSYPLIFLSSLLFLVYILSYLIVYGPPLDT